MSKRGGKRTSKRGILILITVAVMIFVGIYVQEAFKKFSASGAIQGSSVSMKHVETTSAQQDSSSNTVASKNKLEAQAATEEEGNAQISCQAISADGIFSTNAYMISVKDGSVLLDKGAADRIFPASMTKIMTCIIGLEQIPNLDEGITIKQSEIDRYFKEGASRAGFVAGETVPARDIFYGIMLPSGADACLAVADRVSGSEEKFVGLMNQKAKEIGMTNTNFTNPVGMHNDNHYSTCADFAKLMRYAIKNETFRTILAQHEYRTTKTEAHPEGILLQSTCYVGLESTTFPNGAEFLGGKTGFTNAAALTLSSYARFKENEYILVTAHASGQKRAHIKDAVTLYSRLQA